MSRLPTVCILAGGLGTRLGKAVARTPKPLLEVAGEPFLLHQLRLLAANDADHVVLCVGYLGGSIEDAIGHERFGIRIEYSHDGPRPLGTLGAIRRARSLLPDRFLVLYGDTYLRLDYRAAAAAWARSRLHGLMTILRNENRWDTSNVLYANGHVLAYDKHSPVPNMRWIDYGLGGLSLVSLGFVGDDVADLAALYRVLAARGELCGFEAHERFYEIGSPQALAETDWFLRHESACQ